MLKQSAILLYFFFIYIFRFFADGVTVDVNAPASANPGETITVKAVIHKGSNSEFARLMQELPAGFIAEAVETGGASFFFENNKVKFVWTMQDAAKSDITVSYKVTIPASYNGELKIHSKYSYTLNKQSATPVEGDYLVQVGAGSGNTASSSTGNTTGASTTTASNTTPVDSTSKPEATISVQRIVPAETVKGSFEVRIKLVKGDLAAFGKIQDTLPEGCKAQPVLTGGAQFVQEGRIVKFTWFTMNPRQADYEVAYKVVLMPDVNGAQNIHGAFSYVEGEKGKIVPIGNSGFTAEGNPVAMNTNPVDNTSANTGNTTSNTGNSDNSNPNNATARTNGENNSSNTNTASNTTSNTASNTTTNSNTNSGNNDSGNNSSAITSNTSNTNSSSSSNTATTNSSASNSNSSSSDNSNLNANASVSGVPAASTGVTYRVQIAAMSRFVDVSYFSTTFNISETINAEMIDGLNKYTVGSFNQYQDARNGRENIRNKGVNDAFVAAYSSGKRITVQEALMISKQTWVR